MEPLSLFQNSFQRVLFFLSFFLFFTFNLILDYNSYKTFIKEEVVRLDATVLNIYKKENYNIVKLKNENLTFFTSISKELQLKQLQKINLYLITQKISFIEYLKGFYAKSFNHNILESTPTIKTKLNKFINSQHTNTHMSSLYNALFLAINITPSLREFTTNYGIAHLVAISGFHIGIISALLYFILGIIYKPIHQKYYPYRNKRFDLLIIVSFLLLGYLFLLDFVPSLLRAFVMFIFGIFLLRSNIKLLSFETLFIIVLIILALFPKLIFSLSLWFSVAGVFYIFLFLQYFKNLNKYLQLLGFNLWIYLAINPIVHFFFPQTSYEQLYSPLITIAFTLFYPLAAFLHLIGLGYIFDSSLLNWHNIEVFSFEKYTSLWFFIVYIITSFAAIFEKKAFIALHILMGGFTIYLFV